MGLWGKSSPGSAKPAPVQTPKPGSKAKTKPSLNVRPKSQTASGKPLRVDKKKLDSKQKKKTGSAKPKKEVKPPPTTRALEYSRKFLRAIRPLTSYVTLLGGSPFKQVTRKDGTARFVFIPISVHTVIFFLFAIFNSVIFVLFTLGLFTIFLLPDMEFVDKCMYTWEGTMVTRHIVQITMAWTVSAMSALSAWYILVHGKSYGNFFNYWMKAIHRLDMEVTEGSWRYSWLGCVDTFLLVAFLSFEFFNPSTQAVNDASAFIMQAMLRNFGLKIYKETIDQPDNKFCGEYKSDYFLFSLAGFFIQIYSIMAARCFVNQFQFFAKLISNVAKIWNNRLDCALADGVEVDSDPQKRRLTLSRILGDHITIVQLFKLTEGAFRYVLQCFFALTTFTICVQVYYITRVGTVAICEQRENQYESDPNCEKQRNDLNMLSNQTGAKSFRQCSQNLQVAIESSSISAALICYTLYSFASATLAGSLAYIEAMKGYRVIRRFSYAECSKGKERNFVHSLHCSFANANPMRMAAGGYFQISKPLFITVGSSVLNYFIILLQFRPAQINFGCLPPAPVTT